MKTEEELSVAVKNGVRFVKMAEPQISLVESGGMIF